MRIETISNFEEFLKLEEIWNKILEKSQSDYVCLTFEWFKSWWMGFGKDKQLMVILIKEEGRLIGIAPLMLVSKRFRGLPVKEIGFIQNDNSPRCDFIISEKREEVINAIVRYLKRIKNNWDVINFSNLPVESANYEIFKECFKKNRFIFGIKDGLCSPFIRISSDWPTYFSNRSKKFHKVLRNKINRIERLGHYSIQKISTESEYDNVLNNIFDISSKSWKAKFDKDMAGTEENKKFFLELSKICGRKGWVNIWLLNLKDKPIAYEYHLQYKNKLCGLRADFEEKYQESSPGSVLDMNVVKYAFESCLEEYDLCGSSDFYKKNWTETTREHTKLFIFNNSFYSYLLFFLEFRIIHLFKKIRFFKRRCKNLFVTLSLNQ